MVEGDAARFRHELARRAYSESLPALRRIELNRAILAVLEQGGADAARLVHHAEAAQDREALVRHALVAAGAARSRALAPRGGGARSAHSRTRS